jgi:hypothetical protein
MDEWTYSISFKIFLNYLGVHGFPVLLRLLIDLRDYFDWMKGSNECEIAVIHGLSETAIGSTFLHL